MPHGKCLRSVFPIEELSLFKKVEAERGIRLQLQTGLFQQSLRGFREILTPPLSSVLNLETDALFKNSKFPFLEFSILKFEKVILAETSGEQSCVS